MRGPKPKPTEFLTGHFTKAQIAKRKGFQGDPAVSLDPPIPLDLDSLKIWKSFAVLLDRAGILKQTDLYSFACACQSFAESQRRYAVMQAEHDSEARAMNFTQWLKATDSFRRWAVEYGLTPSSRVRLSIDKKPEVDELESILSGAMLHGGKQ